MTKNYLSSVIPSTDQNGNIVSLAYTDNLATMFSYTISQPQLRGHIIGELDRARLSMLTNYLDHSINWKEEEKIWVYLGNLYMIMPPAVSKLYFFINYYNMGMSFFDMSVEKLKRIYEVKKWYTFKELEKVKYPSWD